MNRPDKVFKVAQFFCGIGVGALGFQRARVRLHDQWARFETIGGIDNDPQACADFSYLTGAPVLCADMHELQPAQIRAVLGEETPDCVFTSPPCKGFSGLLGAETAATAKYQKLNELVTKGLHLMCETWPDRPGLIVMENVPRIQSRGAELLAKVRSMLSAYGYVFHESTHDCGVIGGLAQHRKRYLMVARLPRKVTNFVYQPPKKRVRGCGEVIGKLELPEVESAGVLHRLPRLSFVNWVRLAMIPAGGDWRDLPRRDQPTELALALALKTESRPNLFGVLDWRKPAKAVTGSASVSGSNGVAALSDPRVVGVNPRGGKRYGDQLQMAGWEEPAATITGTPDVGAGAQSVVDPRTFEDLTSPVASGAARRSQWARWDLRGWDQPARTVAGDGTNGGFGVVDGRELALGFEPRGNTKGPYGVMSWEQASASVVGSACHDNGPWTVSDPRSPPDFIPVIQSPHDGHWHRPMTTLELGALQGIPSRVRGKPLQLAGKSSSGWRERIGNAVPEGAGCAIGESMLMALLATLQGLWTLGGTGIWVQNEEGNDEEVSLAAM